VIRKTLVCDREGCGAEIEEDSRAPGKGFQALVAFSGAETIVSLDHVCPECLSELVRFVELWKKGPVKVAFRDPVQERQSQAMLGMQDEQIRNLQRRNDDQSHRLVEMSEEMEPLKEELARLLCVHQSDLQAVESLKSDIGTLHGTIDYANQEKTAALMEAHRREMEAQALREMADALKSQVDSLTPYYKAFVTLFAALLPGEILDLDRFVPTVGNLINDRDNTKALYESEIKRSNALRDKISALEEQLKFEAEITSCNKETADKTVARLTSEKKAEMEKWADLSHIEKGPYMIHFGVERDGGTASLDQRKLQVFLKKAPISAITTLEKKR
jgi:hypothetical protein